ncbi:MAG: NADH:flavin oxidoreductase [Polyangiales bacterium]
MEENATDPRYAPLFRPYRSGALALPNRLVMAPMTRNFSPGGVPGENVVAYYRARAKHGTGLLVTEGVLVPHPAANGYKRVPRMYGDEALAGWRRVVEAVHAEGASIVPQLWHVGSIRRSGTEPDPSVPPVAPSAIAHPFYEGKGEVPHALSRAEIAEVVEAYAVAAENALRVGFDGVEIHGAHGYLLDQFLWPVTNQRDDEYGGSLENRARIVCEIVRAIRARTRPDFPIVLRFSQWKMGGYKERLFPTPAELERFLSLLVEAGVDVFHPSTRRLIVPEFEGSELSLAGWVKKLTGKTTIAVGSVGLAVDLLRTNAGQATDAAGIDEVVRRLAADEFDLVAIGRALLADARWPEHVRAGHPERARLYAKELEKVLE